MAKIRNSSEIGDPNDSLNVVGFEKVEDAYRYYQRNFPRNPQNPVFQASLKRGEEVVNPATCWVVFWIGGGTGAPRLLSITLCFADIPLLVVGSWGAQMLLGGK